MRIENRLSPLNESNRVSHHITRSSAQVWRRPGSKNSLYSAVVGSWMVAGSNAVSRGAEERHDVRVRIADAANLEAVLVHVDDLEAIGPDADHARFAHSPRVRLRNSRAAGRSAGVGRGWQGVGTWPASASGQHQRPKVAFLRSLMLPVSNIEFHLNPANSCSRCQFSSRSCLARSSVSDGLPSLSKCLANRPSLRAKSMKSTTSLGLRVDVPVVLHRRVALQRQPLLDRVALAGIVDQQREGPRVDGQAGLLAGHVVGDAVLGLAGRVAARRWPGRRTPARRAPPCRSG